MIAIPLLLHPALWIHRRKETLAFVDDKRLLRRVSVDFTVPHEYGASSDAATALLVAVPGLFAAWIVRTEHPLVGKLVSWLRALILALAGLSIIGAGTLAVDIDHGARQVIWIVLAAMAVGCLVVLSVACVTARRLADANSTADT